ncbi:hypothetical protein TA3x_000786 [Tundrisphaera sp. TA3]|uniref:hypothetical protein n=1 Tax=Tundrisphaera sp. TA3 TaxID=3435775 RepID=UPI003EBA872D
MMRTRDRGLIFLATAAVLASTWGCGDGTPSVSSSNEKVKVKGVVTLKGKPLDRGTILFDPANVNRRDAPAANLEIGKDGTYSGETLAGENSIIVNNPTIAKSPALSANRTVKTLDSGENTVNIEL